jgi:hypothetical protein
MHGTQYSVPASCLPWSCSYGRRYYGSEHPYQWRGAEQNRARVLPTVFR